MAKTIDRLNAVVARTMFASLLLAWMSAVTPGSWAEDGQRPGGALLWEDSLDPAGGQDLGLDVAARGRRVLTAGSITLADGAGAFVVRSYDAATGQLIWQDQDDRGQGNDLAYGVVATRDAAFGVGAVRDPDDADWLVRAYEPDTGAVLWQDQFDKAGNNDFALDAAVEGGRLFVGGITLNPTVDPRFPFNFNWHVRAYEATTGALLWQQETDLAGGNDQSLRLAAGHERVVAVGNVQTTAGHLDFHVRAYDAATGALVWSDQVDGEGGDDNALGVAVEGRRVYAAGTVGADFFLRAYNARTGAVLWEERLDLGGGPDLARTVAARGGRVFAAGRGTNAAGNLDFLVRAYDARTGELLWHDQADGAGGDDAATALAVKGGHVFAAGPVSGEDATCVTVGSGSCLFTVRAYAGTTGALLWENRRANAGGNDFPVEVGVANRRVFAVGRVTNASGGADYVVRALEAGSRGAGEDLH
jgi:glucose dehydrogenase